MHNAKSEISRAEHLQWCKQRALEYCDQNDGIQEPSGKLHHAELNSWMAGRAGFLVQVAGYAGVRLNDTEEMRKFIEGIN